MNYLQILPLVLSCFFYSVSAETTTNTASERYFTYIAQKGDTLWKITDKYLKNSTQWKLIQTINNVADPKKLMPLQTIKIPDYSIKTELLPIAILQQKGDVFFNENNRVIQTHKGSTVVKLNDGSIITVFPESIIKILKHDKIDGSMTTDIFVEKGKMYTHVTKQTNTSRFNVRTPLAVAGVRGTSFQVRVESPTESFTEMDEGEVQITSSTLSTNNLVNVNHNIITGYAAKSTPKGTIIEKRADPINTTKLPTLLVDALVCFTIPTPINSENIAHYKIELADEKSDFINPIVMRIIKKTELMNKSLNLGDLPDNNYSIKITAVTIQGIEGQSVIHSFKREKAMQKKSESADSDLGPM